MSRQLAYLWGGVSLALVALSPVAPRLARGLWPCVFKSLTGLACPTCGVTRAALALAELDVLGALTRYPLPTVFWIAFLAGGFLSAGAALGGFRLPSLPNRIPVWGRVAIASSLIANWMFSIATGV